MKNTLLAAALIAVSCSAFAGGNIEAGKAVAEKSKCASCHSADYNSPTDPTTPKLAGQHKDYLEHALTGYKRGGDSANGRGNAIMGGQVKTLTAQDVKDVSAYLHSLPGSLVVRR